MKPLATRYVSGIQVIASRPRFGPTAGRSAVMFHSCVAVSVVPGALVSKRRIDSLLTPLLVLSRSVDT